MFRTLNIQSRVNYLTLFTQAINTPGNSFCIQRMETAQSRIECATLCYLDEWGSCESFVYDSDLQQCRCGHLYRCNEPSLTSHAITVHVNQECSKDIVF